MKIIGKIFFNPTQSNQEKWLRYEQLKVCVVTATVRLGCDNIFKPHQLHLTKRKVLARWPNEEQTWQQIKP